MSLPAWTRNVKHIQDGEAVTAGVTGRPDRTIDQKAEYLKARLDAAEYGAAVYDIDATVSSDLLVGQPVYWDSTTQQYEAALAAAEVDVESSTLAASESSQVVGLLASKSAATTGNILLAGIATLDFSNSIDGTPTGGRYYLSTAEAGKLVKQRPAVSIPVCVLQGETDTGWRCVVIPQVSDFLNDHIHYRFELEPAPAGTATLTAGHYTITAVDTGLMGWLPASDASFNGNAPYGAQFGYNLAAHEELSDVFPPVPLESCVVIWDKGQDRVGATEVPMGPTGLVIVDRYGIWWMSDCEGDVPWETDDYLWSSVSSESECPRQERMQVTLVYSRTTFATDKTVVTSLQPATGSPIVVTDCAGNAGTTGDLQLDLDLGLLVDDEEEYGGEVIKTLEDDKFKRGWVVEGIVAATDNVTISSTRQRYEDPDDEDSNVVHQGILQLSVETDLGERELSPQIVRLSDVLERYYSGVMYLGFPADKDSSMVIRFNVPPDGLPAAPVLALRLVLFGRATGTLPDLTLTRRILARPYGIVTPVALPTSDTAVTITTSTAVTADEAIELECTEFSIAAGDTVFLTLSRSELDSYAGEVGVIRMTGVVSAG